MKKVASKNFKKPKVAENSKSYQNSKKLPKISKVAEQLVAKPNYDKSPRIKPDLQGDYCNRRHLDKAD